MENLNSKRDIEASCMIIENSEKMDDSNYDHYSKIFNLPTIKHKPLYKKMNGNWDSFLGVLGSSDPWLNAVCLNAKKIETFDINCLNVYYAYLKIAGILALNYQEFIAFFYATDWNQYFCKEHYKKLKNNLPKEICDVWDYLYEKYPDYKIRKLFFTRIYDHDEIVTKLVLPNNIFSNEKEFYRLKKLLTQIKFNYHICDFGEIPDIFHNQTFDIIYLSCMNNLIYDNVHGYNYFTKLKEYDNLLKKDGIIEGGYFYSYQLNDSWTNYAKEQFLNQGYMENKIYYADDYYDLAFIKSKRTN